MQVHRTMIVSAAIAPTCRQLSETIAGPSGAGMWLTGLSPTGEAPATHYISAGLISEEFAALMASPEAMAAASEAFGVPIPLAQCQAILSQADVSEEGGFYAMARLELLMVAEVA